MRQRLDNRLTFPQLSEQGCLLSSLRHERLQPVALATGNPLTSCSRPWRQLGRRAMVPLLSRRSRLQSMIGAILRGVALMIVLHQSVAACVQDSVVKRDKPAAGPANGGNARVAGQKAPLPSTQALRVQVVVPEYAAQGTAISIKLVVNNASSATIRVSQKGCPPDFDVVITRVEGSTIWRRLPSNVVLCDAAMEYPLSPGQSREVGAVSWEQRDSHGRPVGPGRYTVQGFFFGGIAGSSVSETKTPAVPLVIGP